MATVDPLDILTWASDIEAPTIAASEAILFGTRGLTLLCALVSLPLKQQQYLLSASPSLLCPQYPKTGLAASFAAAFFFLTYFSAGSSSFFFFLASFSSATSVGSVGCSLGLCLALPLLSLLQKCHLHCPCLFLRWCLWRWEGGKSRMNSLSRGTKLRSWRRGRKVEDEQLIQRNLRKRLKKRKNSFLRRYQSINRERGRRRNYCRQ